MTGPAGEDAGASKTGRAKPSRRWFWAGGALAVALVAAGLFWREGDLAARLIRADAEQALADPTLFAYARSRGASAYRERCQACHGDQGKGPAGQGVPDLTDGEWLYGTGLVADVERVVHHGIRAGRPRTWDLALMPPYARTAPTATGIPPLGPAETRDVAAFLIAAAGKPADPAAAGRGRAIYDGQGGCFDCHGGDAKGDPAIGAPSLLDGVWLYGDGSADSLFRSIALGHAGVCPGWAGKPEPAKMRALSVYVAAFSNRKEPG